MGEKVHGHFVQWTRIERRKRRKMLKKRVPPERASPRGKQLSRTKKVTCTTVARRRI